MNKRASFSLEERPSHVSELFQFAKFTVCGLETTKSKSFALLPKLLECIADVTSAFWAPQPRQDRTSTHAHSQTLFACEVLLPSLSGALTYTVAHAALDMLMTCHLSRECQNLRCKSSSSAVNCFTVLSLVQRDMIERLSTFRRPENIHGFV